MVKNFLKPGILFVALAVCAGLCIFIGAGIFLLHPSKVIEVAPTAVITVIKAPTPTTAITMAAGVPTVDAANPTGNVSFKVGDYVQIVGTDNQGLSVRSGAGVENKSLFIAAESEIFEIKDGPITSGEYNWYYLLSPKDSGRFGWAVADYLKLTQKP